MTNDTTPLSRVLAYAAELSEQDKRADAARWQVEYEALMAKRPAHLAKESGGGDPVAWMRLDNGLVVTCGEKKAMDEAYGTGDRYSIPLHSGPTEKSDDAIGMVTRINDELIFHPFEGWHEAISQGNNWLYLHSSRSAAQPKGEPAQPIIGRMPTGWFVDDCGGVIDAVSVTDAMVESALQAYISESGTVDARGEDLLQIDHEAMRAALRTLAHPRPTGGISPKKKARLEVAAKYKAEHEGNAEPKFSREYKYGFWAFGRCVPFESNPYARDSEESGSWDAGWLAAKGKEVEEYEL